jgi:protein phosphatase
MDSIALIADLHGNIPALEAVLRDIKRRNISRVFY